MYYSAPPHAIVIEFSSGDDEAAPDDVVEAAVVDESTKPSVDKPPPATGVTAAVKKTKKPTESSGSSIRSAKKPTESSGSSIRSAEPWLIKPRDITVGKKLGTGAFGVVWKGKWHHNNVAIKQLKVDSGTAALDKAMTEFANEIGRMASMQPHENVVLLYGVTKLENGDMAAVVEYCAHGSCHDALYGAKARALKDDELIRIARGAASGLAHLHRLGIIHRDIAARNVLLTRLDVAKVADFGMSRALAENAYNEQQTVHKVGPLKWMAPEQIERHVYSKATDVFSFGVLLFEIFAREPPWKDVNNIVACQKVLNGERMTPPKRVPRPMRKLMVECWAHEPKERPRMSSAQEQIADLLVDQSETSI
jgi:activated CDC42 kinase 1